MPDPPMELQYLQLSKESPVDYTQFIEVELIKCQQELTSCFEGEC